MKFLQNKGFVIILAILALALVGRNLFWPVIKRKIGTRAVAKAAPAPAPRPEEPATAKKAAPPASLISLGQSLASRVRNETKALAAGPVAPPAKIDISAVRSSSSEWALNPRRDPFHVRGGIKDGKSARELLTLMGTLHQTESVLAVLNNKVLAAGDSILGFKLETIENDRVWVVGPNGRESVEFAYIATIPSAAQAEQSRPAEPGGTTVQ